MHLTRITIENESKGAGFSFGKNVQKEMVTVKNGDLISGSEIDVVIVGSNGKYLQAEIPQTFENRKLIEIMADDEGLIGTKEITAVRGHNLFEIGKKWVFPHHMIKSIVFYILSHEYLWNNSKLRFVSERVVASSARIFGISFQQAIEKIAEKGFSKARLYCEKRSTFERMGVVAEMLANIYTEKDGLTTMEIWQGVANSSRVYYAHGILNKSKRNFIHFDCAIINMDITEQHILFEENRKIKGGDYLKLFRIDGDIDKKYVFELASQFFPLDNLIEEYFEIERIEQ
jgi:hypothetical protein